MAPVQSVMRGCVLQRSSLKAEPQAGTSSLASLLSDGVNPAGGTSGLKVSPCPVAWGEEGFVCCLYARSWTGLGFLLGKGRCVNPPRLTGVSKGHQWRWAREESHARGTCCLGPAGSCCPCPAERSNKDKTPTSVKVILLLRKCTPSFFLAITLCQEKSFLPARAGFGLQEYLPARVIESCGQERASPGPRTRRSCGCAVFLPPWRG